MSTAPAYTTFRVGIDKTWEMSDFAEFFGGLQFLDLAYSLQYASLNEIERVNRLVALEGWWNDQKILGDLPAQLASKFVLEAVLERQFSLQVKQISFASPGFVDITGIGRMATEIRLFISDIIEKVISSKDREIARDSAEQDVLAKRIKNAEAAVKLANKVGLDKEAQRIIVQGIFETARLIEAKVVQGKITSAEHRSGPQD